MAATVYVNGRITGERDAVVSVLDHGFLYGEGVYETLRTYGGRLFLFDRHARRLRRSAAMIALDVPFTDEQLLEAVTQTMTHAAVAGEAYVRVLVTRGVGDLTYDPQATPSHTLVIIVKPQVDPPPEAYRDGVRVAIVDIIRNHPGSVNPMIKSNNLMNNALAMQEAIRRGAFEGVMRNYRGELTECTTANLFVVKDGRVLTPPLDAGLLPGITREFVFEIGRAGGIEVREAVLRDDDLYGADEAFLTSTTREAVPIVTVDDRTIGTGKPGPVTMKLLEAFRTAARSG
ncbi:MAG TPA: aminotransferase class IV [Vicinamibacterales bacterium]|nr:aminotransferase class IV [Vicinamibacterales bacterium]